MTRTLRLALGGIVAALAVGCSNTEPTGPKETLSDKEKQQVKELNQQRQSEWGSTSKKK